MDNELCYMEFHSTDPEKSRKFFEEMFTWEYEDVDMGGTAYAFIKPKSGPSGGLLKQPHPGAPSMWLNYIMVDDLAAMTEKAEKLGGSVTLANKAIPGYGKFSVITEPTGGVFALWESEQKQD